MSNTTATPTITHPGSMDVDTPDTNAALAQHARDLANESRRLATETMHTGH